MSLSSSKYCSSFLLSLATKVINCVVCLCKLCFSIFISQKKINSFIPKFLFLRAPITCLLWSLINPTTHHCIYSISAHRIWTNYFFFFKIWMIYFFGFPLISDSSFPAFFASFVFFTEPLNVEDLQSSVLTSSLLCFSPRSS